MKINGFIWVPNVAALILTVLIVMIGVFVYVQKIKKFKTGEVVTGYCLIVEMFISWCRKTVLTIAGPKLKWSAPYFAFLLIYISVNNLISLLGLANPITQLTVPLALGSVTFLMMFIIAIKYRSTSFFKEYLNPIQWFTQFSPLISISFRLFGNILSGLVLLSLVYSFTGYIWKFIPIIGQINLLGGFLSPPLHFYFDIFGGILQSFVFSSLTITYWGGVVSSKDESITEKKKMLHTKSNIIESMRQKQTHVE